MGRLHSLMPPLDLVFGELPHLRYLPGAKLRRTSQHLPDSERDYSNSWRFRRRAALHSSLSPNQLGSLALQSATCSNRLPILTQLVRSRLQSSARPCGACQGSAGNAQSGRTREAWQQGPRCLTAVITISLPPTSGKAASSPRARAALLVSPRSGPLPAAAAAATSAMSPT